MVGRRGRELVVESCEGGGRGGSEGEEEEGVGGRGREEGGSSRGEGEDRGEEMEKDRLRLGGGKREVRKGREKGNNKRKK